MTKPPVPVPPSGQPLTRQEALARLRTASGRPERRMFDCICSVTSKGYSVTFERTDPRERFKVAKVEGLKELALSAWSKGSGPGAAQTFNVEEFEADWKACPWCGAQGNVHGHECAILCGGAVRRTPDGKREIACPVCSSTAQLTGGAATSVQGVACFGPTDLTANAPRLGQEVRKLLPKWVKR